MKGLKGGKGEEMPGRGLGCWSGGGGYGEEVEGGGNGEEGSFEGTGVGSDGEEADSKETGRV